MYKRQEQNFWLGVFAGLGEQRFRLCNVQALMLNFPLHVGSPGLLAHPAAPPAAVKHLEGRQVAGLVVESHEAARLQKRHHLGGLGAVVGHVPRRGIGAILLAEQAQAVGSPVFFGIGLLLCRNGVQTAS